MNLRQLIDKGTETISRIYPEREAREMVLAYLVSVLGIQRHTHIIEPSYEVSEKQTDEIFKAFERMASGEPLQYVLGTASFYGRDFCVTPSVLIPRPETELLCRIALDNATKSKNLRILDLCTGSGCIAWTMSLELPGVYVTAVDISDAALEVASSQDFGEEISSTDARVPEFIKSDVLSDELVGRLSDGELKYDIILSNPPYVMDKEKSLMRTNVLDHEPHLALFVPDDDPLRFYKAIADHSAKLLSPEGLGVVEINEALGAETADLFKEAGFADVRVISDLNDRERFVFFRWK